MSRGKLIQILSVIAAIGVAAVGVVEAMDGVIDAPWVLPLSLGLYQFRRLVQMLETVIGADLDGDGVTGPPVARSPWIVGLIAAALAFALLACGGTQPIGVTVGTDGAGCWDGAWSASLTTGETTGDVSVSGDGRVWAVADYCTDGGCLALAGGSVEASGGATEDGADGSVRVCGFSALTGKRCHVVTE